MIDEQQRAYFRSLSSARAAPLPRAPGRAPRAPRGTSNRRRSRVASIKKSVRRARTTVAKGSAGVGTAAGALIIVRSPSSSSSSESARREGDKFEPSPTSLAKCQQCRKKIMKGQIRVGIEGYDYRYKRYTHKYYHKTCYKGDLSKLSLKAASPEDELARHNKEKVQGQVKLRERTDLRECLRLLRSKFARYLNRQPFMIFHDSVLDDLVVHMPTNRREMLEIKGIAEKKFQDFGGPILEVIRHYQRRYAQIEQRRLVGTHRKQSTKESSILRRNSQRTPQYATEIITIDDDEPSRAAAVTAATTTATTPRTTPRRAVNPQKSAQSVTPENANNDEDDDDELMEVETLSCEEIVRRRFEEAERSGHVFSID